MKRFLAVGLLVVLAAVTAMTWSADRVNAARFVTKPVLWAGGVDTTFIEDENDTIRTQAIDLSDWDFSMPGTSVEMYYGSVAFVVSGANDGVADSIYYVVEKTWDGTNWTQGALTAAAGGCAVPQGGVGATVPATFAGAIVIELDELGGVNVGGLVPKAIRFKVAGDQSGSNPALSRVRMYITYPSLHEF